MPLTARRHVRKMRGGAQSHLLEADDGKFYVVKFLNNPQHRRVLVNEWLSSVFLHYLQIPAPEPALIHVTEEFLSENLEVYISLGTCRMPVQPGWHFGSRYPGDPSRLAVYDFVPDSLLPQVVNLADFLGMLVYDKWAGNVNGRQAIFFRARVQDWTPATGPQPPRLGFLAMMVDHGFAFGGPSWEFTDAPLQGIYPRQLVYEGVRSVDSFQPWLNQVMHFPEEVVDCAYKQVPPQWIDGEEDAFERLLERLLIRRRHVPELIGDIRRARANLFPNWR